MSVRNVGLFNDGLLITFGWPTFSASIVFHVFFQLLRPRNTRRMHHFRSSHITYVYIDCESSSPRHHLMYCNAIENIIQCTPMDSTIWNTRPVKLICSSSSTPVCLSSIMKFYVQYLFSRLIGTTKIKSVFFHLNHNSKRTSLFVRLYGT